MIPATGSAMFEPLRIYGAPALEAAAAPGLTLLQRLLDARGAVTTRSGRQLRLIAQQPKAQCFEDRFEARIWLRGEVQAREESWHDVFNVLVWLAFPHAKAALNARHYAALQAQWTQGQADRGPVADTLTLFDEGGIAIACAGEDLAHDLRQFRWQRLFVEKRIRVMREMRFFLLGHALYEKALRPFTGITGRAIVLPVERKFLEQPLAAQLDGIDRRLAGHIADLRHMNETRELAPLPILGVPGWHPDNESAAYYDDITHFRARRHPDARTDGGT